MTDALTIERRIAPRKGVAVGAGRRARWTCAAAFVAICGVLIGWATPLSAQGTAEEREACTPDVFRLCSYFIPDPTAIEACLRRKKPELSVACRKVVFPATQPDELGASPAVRGGR
ncbi:hypothetical protein ACQR1Y_13175 [Bradyrhizobium sp. HKCCYLRH3099]|uniref:hypothetical protein n=1 Tax=unclassified Bradyrhizobium TaxID=2631580 RepID=UPI003EBE0FE5